MEKHKNIFLLTKYYHIGWLERAYYDGKNYCRPYSAEDRLKAGKLLYEDFLCWKKGTRLIRDYDAVKVDVGLSTSGGIQLSFSAERFRRVLRGIPSIALPVIYKIVLLEEEIKPKKTMSTREKLYFNDEIKGLLCRGLDAACSFYAKRTY